ncbi:MAG: NPCBM/NEW2 domain-containing protein [Ginsengibacter sp.]
MIFYKRLYIVIFFLTTGINLQAQNIPSDFHDWASTPPMGWNSWDCFGPTVNEAEVKANADYMAKNLKNYGWKYIVVDIRWYVANDKSHGYNETDPQYNIDKYGRFLPAVNRFPSAAGGKGFKPLADYIHGKGLKFGIHIMRGVPVIAVDRNLPVEGTEVTAKDIYTDEGRGQWLHDMYTIVAGKKGAQEYYNSIFKLYASWGLDFVKVDDLTAPYHEDEVDMIRSAIDHCGRQIVLSTSPGETPIEDAQHIQQHANMWRTVGDFWDNWPQVKEHFGVFERWNKWRASGAWPDGDMLPLGRIGIRAERGEPRMNLLTHDEQYTLMTLMAIFRSPLMFGGNLPDNDPFTLALLTNKNMLHVLNNSTNNRKLFNKNDQVAWIADDTQTKDKFLAVFNIADQEEIDENKAVWKSEIINRKTTAQSMGANVDITGADKLYLVAKDGGDDNGWDHADWINPVLYNGSDSMRLTALPWVKASAGWEHPRIDSSVSGKALIVNNKTYTNGIGTHANSVIEYNLPKGYTNFKASYGLDKAAAMQSTGGTIQFFIFTQNPAGPAPADSMAIPVSLNELGFKIARVTNLWSGEDAGSFSGTFAPVIKRHACGFYRLSEAKN